MVVTRKKPTTTTVYFDFQYTLNSLSTWSKGFIEEVTGRGL